MILKLLIIMYAWAWNTAPWQPVAKDDWGLVMMGGFFLDLPALILTAFLISQIVMAVRKRRHG